MRKSGRDDFRPGVAEDKGVAMTSDAEHAQPDHDISKTRAPPREPPFDWAAGPCQALQVRGRPYDRRPGQGDVNAVPILREER